MFERVPPLSDVDVLTAPDSVAAELATSPSRGEDMSALLMLDPDALSDAGRIDLLVAFERHIALLQAAQQQVLASLDGRALDWSGTKLVDYTREQVGAAFAVVTGHRGTAAVYCAGLGGAAAGHPAAAAHRAAHLPARHEARRSRGSVR
jgi:hypothetical protein